MAYSDLRDFLKILERENDLRKITDHEISPTLEMTEICQRVLQKQGPAILFANPKGFNIPVLANLFGTLDRITLAMGLEGLGGLRELGSQLALLKEPKPPHNLREIWNKLPLMKQVMAMRPALCRSGPCQDNVINANDVDLYGLPIQTCWPEDVAPLITWGLVVTKGPRQERQNIGIYRQQVIAKNKVIMRWLAHRGGALDFKDWQQQHPDKPFPVAVVLGADPGTTLAAVTPVPDHISEYAFAGLLRGVKTELVKCILHPDLFVPRTAEFVLEGYIYPNETAVEGPFGDHTGYYNEQASFPVFTIERITHRNNPIYHSTYTGKPPDEPAILGFALNELFIPILQKQFPEIQDFYLPPEGCSYRLAVVSLRKQYPGHAKQILMGIWSFLRQFMYTKFILVVDEDINARDWKEVIWAMTTRMDPARDTVTIENTPIDYLDFASPVSGLGSKMGFDATNKWPSETNRPWGKPIVRDEAVKKYIDDIWNNLGL